MRPLSKVSAAITGATSAALGRKVPQFFLMACLGVLVWAQSPPSKSDDVKAHLTRAEQYLKSSDADAAAKEYRAVLALEPRNVEAHVNLGAIAMMHGDCLSASKDFRQALLTRPANAKAEALLGICQRRLGDPKAGALLQASFSKLTEVKLRIQVGMELVALYEQQGDAEHAVAVLQKLVEADPDNVEILFQAQRLYRGLADDTLNKLAIVAPGSARMQQIIAQRLINSGDAQSAIEHYRRALEIDPHVPGVHFELAQAILESAPTDPNVQDAARKELETAIASDGDSSSVQCKLGRIALMRSDLDLAHKYYARAVELNPRDPESQLGLGTVLMMSGQLQDAKKFLELAVLSDPLNDAAHYRLARVYRDLHLTEKAEAEVKLSEEIRKAKEQVASLYRQMNQRPAFERDDGLPDGRPTNKNN